jgi:hypothetical protein
MSIWLYIFIGALLVRLDGWGPEEWYKNKPLVWLANRFGIDPQAFITKICGVFGVWSCGGFMLLASWAYFGDSRAARSVGLGFVLWRAPELGDYWGPDWKYWPQMFLRGGMTSVVCFIILTVYLYNTVYGGWLFIPMGVAQMLLYNGLQRFNRDVLPIPNFHLMAEWGTGAVFTACVVLIGVGV